MDPAFVYAGAKRARVPEATDRLSTPVAFTAARPKPARIALLPVIKQRPTNPPRAAAVATVAVDRAAAAAAAAAGDLVPVPVVRPPVAQHLDDYLALVGSMYYMQSEIGQASAAWALVRRTTLGVLTAPVREPSVLDRWSPYEIALFEAAICLAGKLFGQVAAAVKTKSVAQCVEFYYVWKCSKNYGAWKAAYRSGDDESEDDDD